MLRRYLETIKKAKLVINKLRRHIKELGLTCDFSVCVYCPPSPLTLTVKSGFSMNSEKCLQPPTTCNKKHKHTMQARLHIAAFEPNV